MLWLNASTFVWEKWIGNHSCMYINLFGLVSSFCYCKYALRHRLAVKYLEIVLIIITNGLPRGAPPSCSARWRLLE
jgi:hypothetical protein